MRWWRRLWNTRLASLTLLPNMRPNANQTGAKTADTSVDVQDGSGRVDPPEMTPTTLQGAHSHPVPAQVSLVTGWRRIMGHGG